VEKIIPSLSYKYLLSYILTDRTGNDIGFSSKVRIPYMPMHMAGASMEIRWKSGSLIVSGRYEGLRYANYNTIQRATVNTDKLDPHFLLNLSLNQSVNKNLALFAVLRNILNEPYVSMADYHMPGITLTAGARVNFAGSRNP
jgi:outer membrane receptor protein involved in Fe transport